MIILVGLLAHYRCVQLPKRSVQLEMTDRQSDQIKTIQDTLVAHGYLPTPKPKKNRRKVKARKSRKQEEQGKEDGSGCSE